MFWGRIASRTRSQLVTFYGKSGAESVGVVDMLAIRKDHAAPVGVMRRGDALQIILVQVKGGTAARFFRLRTATATEPWTEVMDLDSVFR